MTTRRAIVITNPGLTGAEDFCSGVLVDAKNYPEFLTAPFGGAWQRSEITSMDRPTAADVRRAVRSLSSVDYSIVVFSGHGYYSRQRDSTIVALNQSDEIDSNELRAGANRRLLVLDCCRVRVDDHLIEQVLKFSSSRPPTLDPARCRAAYDRAIGACPTGQVIAFSCGIDETSTDHSVTGGLYSSNLLTLSRQWAERSTGSPTWSIIDAHTAASAAVTRRNGQQHPQIEQPRSGPYFPFAVVA